MARRSIVRSDDHTILVVNDRHEALVSVRSLLERDGHSVLVAAENSAALDLLVRHRADVLLVEQAMIETDSGECLRRVRALDDCVPVVVSGRALDPANRRRLIRRFDLHGIYDPDAGSGAVLELIESALASRRCMRSARTARELRDLVLAKFCHELRNSLHVIRGYTEILRGDPATFSMERSAGEILDRLGVAGDTALGLAQDYLEQARLDAPGATARRERVDIDALLDEACEPTLH